MSPFIPNFNANNYEIKAPKALDPILQKQQDAEVRKKVAFVCAAIFCGLCLLRAKTGLQGISLRLTQAVQYTAMLASLTYFAEMACRGQMEVKIDFDWMEDPKEEIDIKAFSKGRHLITEFIIPKGATCKNIEELAKFTRLRKLALPQKVLANSEVMKKLFSDGAKPFYEKLEELNLRYYRSPRYTFLQNPPIDFSIIKKMPQLKKLWVGYTNFNEEHLPLLKGTKVECLSVEGCWKLGDGKGFKELVGLKGLDITDTFVGLKNLPVGIKKLTFDVPKSSFALIANFKDLEELELSWTASGSVQLKYIPDTVIKLHLQIPGLEDISEISHCTKLRELDIAFTFISKGLDTIPLSVEKLDIQGSIGIKDFNFLKRLINLKEILVTKKQKAGVRKAVVNGVRVVCN